MTTMATGGDDNDNDDNDNDDDDNDDDNAFSKSVKFLSLT